MILFFVALFMLTSPFLPETDPYFVVQEKRITVSGNTSIGSFNCTYEIVEKSDTLYLPSFGRTQTYHFNIPTEVFKCGNFLLNKDFQKTLKSSEFPHISVEVANIKQSHNGDILGSLTLIIAGKTKEMGLVTFNKNNTAEKDILSTNIKLLVSDFDLKPPKKFGGLINTDDIMYINVDLYID